MSHYIIEYFIIALVVFILSMKAEKDYGTVNPHTTKWAAIGAISWPYLCVLIIIEFVKLCCWGRK